MRRLSKIWRSGSHVDWLLGKKSHLTKYSTFPFLFRCFRIFSALNTVSLSITISSGVDSFAFWSWFFVVSWTDSFDSFSFWGCGDNCVSILTGFKSVSLGSASAETDSKQSFGISDSLMYDSAGSSKGGGSIWSQIRINKWLHTICVTRKSNFFIGDRAQLKVNRWQFLNNSVWTQPIMH